MHKALFVVLLGMGVLAGCTLHVTKTSEDVLPQTAAQPFLPSYNVSIEQAATASIHAMESLGWQTDYAKSKLPVLVVGMVPGTLTSNGEIVEVSLMDKQGGKTEVYVVSRSVLQAVDWGRNADNIKQFYSALNGVITSGMALSGPNAPRTPGAIIVTAGPISQPSQALGEVHVNTTGMINFGSMLNDALFRSPLSRAVQGPTPAAHTAQLNTMLRQAARQQYGSQLELAPFEFRGHKLGELLDEQLLIQKGYRCMKSDEFDRWCISPVDLEKGERIGNVLVRLHYYLLNGKFASLHIGFG